MTKTEQIREQLYRIVDSFLVEAKTLEGQDRSLDRLNEDRHLAVDALLALFSEQRQEEHNTEDGWCCACDGECAEQERG